MRVIRLATRLATLILLCAGTSRPQEPCPTPTFQVAEKTPATSQTAIGLAVRSKDGPGRKLLFIADNQEHLLTGGPIRSMSPLSERYATSVALRSPLANVGGLQLLREALRFGRREGVHLVLHLGDAADISCPDELTSVFNALDQEAFDIGAEETTRIWFMTPGNHDGLLAGNLAGYQPELYFDISKHPWIYTTPPLQGLKEVERGWLNACLSPTNSRNNCRANILTKEDAINRYLERLKARKGAVSAQLQPKQVRIKDKGKVVDITEIIIGKTNVKCKVEKIEIESQGYTAIARTCPRTKVDEATTWVGPYASFIIQKLDIEGTRIILLDTSNYLNPTEITNVLFNGSITKLQRDLVEAWFFDSINRKNVILAGHHPLDDLPGDAQQWITENSGRYISAHVHRSANLIEHRVKRWKTMELNIGSTLDYPSQAVVAKITPNAMSFRVAGADVAKTKWSGFLEKCETNRAEWMLNREFYRDYTRGTYAKHLLKSLLEAESVRRAAAVAPLGPNLEIPTGTKVRDWLLLDRALQAIREDKEESGVFWACQAYYASEATRREKSVFEKLFGGSKSGAEATGDWFSFLPP